MRSAGRLWMKLSDWRVEGTFPDLPRVVVAIAPHSSNWDFVNVVALVFALGLRVSFIGKHTLFLGPLGGFMRWVGGVPVDRRRPEDAAGAAAQRMRETDGMWLGMTPEGTRRAGSAYKSGFYRIAAAADVPVLPVFLDYRRRVIGILPPVETDLPLDEGVARVRAQLLAHGCRRDARARPPS